MHGGHQTAATAISIIRDVIDRGGQTTSTDAQVQTDALAVGPDTTRIIRTSDAATQTDVVI
jgi:hypothetical protein